MNFNITMKTIMQDVFPQQLRFKAFSVQFLKLVV